MLLNLQKHFILLKVPGAFWLAELTSCNISARAEPSHFTLELLEPKLMNEPGRATEKPARAEPKRAGSWLDPPLLLIMGSYRVHHHKLYFLILLVYTHTLTEVTY